MCERERESECMRVRVCEREGERQREEKREREGEREREWKRGYLKQKILLQLYTTAYLFKQFKWKINSSRNC